MCRTARSRPSVRGSALGNAQREMVVYTPPGYDEGHVQLSGAVSDSRRWRYRGLVVDGRPRQQHSRQPARREEGQADDRRDALWLDAFWRTGDDSDATKDPFNDEMMKDIIPFIQANYRTLATPENRALSGLSMGGIQTLNTGSTISARSATSRS